MGAEPQVTDRPPPSAVEISFRRAPARTPTAEERLARAAASIVGGSYLAIGLLMLVAYALSLVASGEMYRLANAFMLKVLLTAILYAASVTLLATLPGKSARRRLASWLYSAVFHAGLLLYVGVLGNFGSGMLLLCAAEVITLALSVAGLGLLIYHDALRTSGRRGAA